MLEERLRVRRRLNLHAKHNPGVIVPRVAPPTIDVDDTILDSGASRPLLARKYVGAVSSAHQGNQAGGGSYHRSWSGKLQ